jgi:hypothetical protein
MLGDGIRQKEFPKVGGTKANLRTEAMSSLCDQARTQHAGLTHS